MFRRYVVKCYRNTNITQKDAVFGLDGWKESFLSASPGLRRWWLWARSSTRRPWSLQRWGRSSRSSSSPPLRSSSTSSSRPPRRCAAGQWQVKLRIKMRHTPTTAGKLCIKIHHTPMTAGKLHVKIHHTATAAGKLHIKIHHTSTAARKLRVKIRHTPTTAGKLHIKIHQLYSSLTRENESEGRFTNGGNVPK